MLVVEVESWRGGSWSSGELQVGRGMGWAGDRGGGAGRLHTTGTWHTWWG